MLINLITFLDLKTPFGTADYKTLLDQIHIFGITEKSQNKRDI